MQFEKRVTEKRKHLTEGPVGGSSGQSESVFSPGKPPSMKVISERNKDDDSFSDDDSNPLGSDHKRQRVKTE
jgi:hypothetical protein